MNIDDEGKIATRVTKYDVLALIVETAADILTDIAGGLAVASQMLQTHANFVEEKETFQKIQKLGNVKIDDRIKELVTRRLFDIPKEERLDSDSLSTNKHNKLSRFAIDLNGEIQGKGDNLWGLFSGVTKYTTHSMRKGDNTEGKIFGQVGFKERQIWDSLVELV